MKQVNIIVPVYGDWPTLSLNIESLARYYGNSDLVDVYYVNDCGPEADLLEENIQKNIQGYENFHYHRNEKNLGFVKNNNYAVNNLINKTGDVLLLNSDTKVTAGFLEELVRILYSDTSIGIVNPRSNNATIWSVPMNGSLAQQPIASYRAWKKLIKTIPESYITPTSHGFCMIIRREIIDKIGLFDEVYGRGYGEENDFTMRALKNGWKCAVANKAFVFHYESKSFGDEARLELSRKNRKILDERYPEYTRLLNTYLATIQEQQVRKDSTAWKITKKVYSGLEYAHDNGYRKTIKKAAKFVDKKTAARFRRNSNNTPSLKLWTNELTNSGAPLVLLDVIRDIVSSDKVAGDGRKIELLHPQGCRIEESYVEKVKALGVTVMQDPVIDRFVAGDTVILNSSGHGLQLYDDLLNNIEQSVVRHLFFYIHEDSPDWTNMNSPAFIATKQRMDHFLKQDKITIYVPSERTKQKWAAFFDTNRSIHVMSGRVNLTSKDIALKNEDDFNTIQFVVSGTVEPRKMQQSILGAFDCFYDTYFVRSPEMYREWNLDIVGAYENEPMNFYNNNVKKYDAKYDGRITIHNKMSSDKALKVIKDSNVSIMYSSDESYSMVVMEGMVFGHPIIRSEASGRDEQLKPGINGWAVDTTNLADLLSAIEELLNKDKTPASRLASMSKESTGIAKKNINSTYRIVSDIEAELQKFS